MLQLFKFKIPIRQCSVYVVAKDISEAENGVHRILLDKFRWTNYNSSDYIYAYKTRVKL